MDNQKSSNPNDYLAKISLALGLLGLSANFTFVQLNQVFFPVGTVFSILLALSMGGRAALTSSVIATIPVALWSGDIVDGFRIIVSVTALGYYYESKSNSSAHFAYFMLGSLVSCFTLSALPLEYLITSVTFEMVMVTLVALLLTSQSIRAQITNKPQLPNFRQTVANIGSAIYVVGFLGCALLSYLLAPEAIQANFTLLTVSLLISLTAVSVFCSLLGSLWESHFESDLATPVNASSFSGLNASTRRIQNNRSTENFTSQIDVEQGQNAPGLLAVSATDRIVFINQTFRNLLGLETAELNGLPLNELPHHATFKELCQSARNGQSKTVELKIENGKDLRYLQFTVRAVGADPLTTSDSSADNLVITVRDVSHKRCLPETELQQSKLHSLARNISGLVHDLNNQLTSICGLVSSARNSTATNKRNEQLDRALKAANESARLLKQIMEFAQSGPAIRSSFTAIDLVRENLALLRQALGPMADIKISDLANAGLLGNRELLAQALISILGNIRNRYSESETKRIEITIELEQFDQAMADLVPGGRPGNFVRLTIRDFAPALTASAVRQAFKTLNGEISAVDGFDLSVAYSIIRSHDGFMVLERHRQEGNSIVLYLPEQPRTSRQPSAAIADQPIQQNLCIPHGNGEQVLVVEDDSQVRSVICQMLSGLGYHVKSCSSGQEALELCEQQQFALILTDLMMPNMSGLEFVKELNKHSTSKVLMMTGYVLPEEQNSNYHILNKPFDVGKLASSVRAALS